MAGSHLIRQLDQVAEHSGQMARHPEAQLVVHHLVTPQGERLATEQCKQASARYYSDSPRQYTPGGTSSSLIANFYFFPDELPPLDNVAVISLLALPLHKTSPLLPLPIILAAEIRPSAPLLPPLSLSFVWPPPTAVPSSANTSVGGDSNN